ncbi:MAG: hypothetical protein ACKPJD_03520, partial [Planctomycetaceae bacterium]
MSSTTRPTTEGSGNFLLGSCVSLAVHLAILLLGTLLLKGCQQASPGTAGGEVFREVGLFVVDGAEDGRSDVGLLPGAGTDEQTQQAPQIPATANSDADHAVRDCATCERVS